MRSGPKPESQVLDSHRFVPSQSPSSIDTSLSQNSCMEAFSEISDPLGMDSGPAKMSSLFHGILSQNEGEQKSLSMNRVSEWQRDMHLHPGTPKIVNVLFKACVTAFAVVYQTLRNGTQSLEASLLTSLQEEFRKFYVWKDTICSSHQDLAAILRCSRNLTCIVLTLMIQWSHALNQGVSISVCLRTQYLEEELKPLESYCS